MNPKIFSPGTLFKTIFYVSIWKYCPDLNAFEIVGYTPLNSILLYCGPFEIQHRSNFYSFLDANGHKILSTEGQILRYMTMIKS